MGKKVEIKVGQRFGRLTVLQEDSKRDKSGAVYYVCKCDCGTIKSICGIAMRRGVTRSCGCYNMDVIRKEKRVIREPLYHIYAGIRSRCYSKKDPSYHNYGGRGIKMCDEWRSDFYSFQNWAFDNGYKKGLWIDRIDNDGNYEPGNCRWTTAKVQQRNKRTNINATIHGETKCLTEWAEEYDIKPCTILRRWELGWRGEELLKPVDATRSHGQSIKAWWDAHLEEIEKKIKRKRG